jgi:BA14K-like protein
MVIGSRLKQALVALVVGVGVSAAVAEATPFVRNPHVEATAATVDVNADDTAGRVVQVQYRGRGYGGRSYGGRSYGRGYGLPLLGAGIIAGAIIADRTYRPRYRYYDAVDYDGPYYRPANYQGSNRQLCAENFRSFEWRTGLYTTYGGEKRLCPYLR